jgi:hypothetical protein
MICVRNLKEFWQSKNHIVASNFLLKIYYIMKG